MQLKQKIVKSVNRYNFFNVYVTLPILDKVRSNRLFDKVNTASPPPPPQARGVILTAQYKVEGFSLENVIGI